MELKHYSDQEEVRVLVEAINKESAEKKAAIIEHFKDEQCELQHEYDIAVNCDFMDKGLSDKALEGLAFYTDVLAALEK